MKQKMKKRNSKKVKSFDLFEVEKTGYDEYGYYHVGSVDLKDTSLDSLEILCSGMCGQMTDVDIEQEHKKTCDYDANEMFFNIWVNGFLIQFHYELFGIHVNYNVCELERSGHVHSATKEDVMKVASAVQKWLCNYHIEDISEEFYKVAEQGISQQIVDEFKK